MIHTSPRRASGSAALEKDRFINARAEQYRLLREAFEQGQIDLDPDDDQLAAQLGSLKWALTSRGQVKIESKDDMRKRGMPSPDRADALVMAWTQGTSTQIEVEEGADGRSLTGDVLDMEW
jgi:hypothetical protein